MDMWLKESVDHISFFKMYNYPIFLAKPQGKQIGSLLCLHIKKIDSIYWRMMFSFSSKWLFTCMVTISMSFPCLPHLKYGLQKSSSTVARVLLQQNPNPTWRPLQQYLAEMQTSLAALQTLGQGIFIREANGGYLHSWKEGIPIPTSSSSTLISAAPAQ